MNQRKYLTFAAWAGGSFLSTLILMAPARLDAVGPEDRQTTAPAQSGAVDFVIQLPGGGASSTMGRRVTLSADSPLTFELLASNTESRSVELPVSIVVLSANSAPLGSRSIPMMRESWRSSETISLAPRERTRLTFSPQTRFQPGSNITVQVLVNNRTVQMLALSIDGSAVTVAPALRQGVIVTPSAPTPPPAVAPVNGVKVPAGTSFTFEAPSSPATPAAPTTRASASTGNLTVLPAATVLKFE
jgi:hypothetical protein